MSNILILYQLSQMLKYFSKFNIQCFNTFQLYPFLEIAIYVMSHQPKSKFTHVNTVVLVVLYI